MSDSALDSFATGASALFLMGTPAGWVAQAAGATPYGAPDGWGAGETVEAVTGFDTSDTVDAHGVGAVEATAQQMADNPFLPATRGLDAAAELQTAGAKKLGFLPTWWAPWMTKGAWLAGGVAALAIVAGPYVAPFIAQARK